MKTRTEVRQSLWVAVSAFLGLVFSLTVRELRTANRSAAIGVLMPALTLLLTVSIFYYFMIFIGGRPAPIRTDPLTFIFAGFLIFFMHVNTLTAVSGAMSSEGLLRHKRATPFLLMCVKAFAAGYKMNLVLLLMLALNFLIRDQWEMQNGLVFLTSLFLAWIGAVAVGGILIAANRYLTWGSLLQTAYIRVCFLTSGKFMIASQLPDFMRDVMGWNPLFHVLDQFRGAMFLNYAARTTDLLYPVAVYFPLLVVAMLVENYVRNHYSTSHYPVA
ncbi:ABC transporter permease [Rhodobacteraceae bacterium NNCM2]|nr:ABC transporter permease [Coraliihabitans acroporae]